MKLSDNAGLRDIERHNYEGSQGDKYNYKGLQIHAAPGIHEFVVDYAMSKFDGGSSVLILGAGAGSLDARLYDSGFEKITALDINPDNYANKNPNIEFVEADLNSDFSSKLDKKFDLIVCVEIIEHVYSTAHFLKNCRSLLEKDGVVLVTTPNPRSYVSRWKFLFTGYHKHFEGIPKLYEHINPIHIDIFRHHCYFQKLQITHIESFEIEFETTLIRRFMRRMLSTLLALYDRCFNKQLLSERESILFLEFRLAD